MTAIITAVYTPPIDFKAPQTGQAEIIIFLLNDVYAGYHIATSNSKPVRQGIILPLLTPNQYDRLLKHFPPHFRKHEHLSAHRKPRFTIMMILPLLNNSVRVAVLSK